VDCSEELFESVHAVAVRARFHPYEVHGTPQPITFVLTTTLRYD
jgi:hypothetical protein